MPRVCVANGFCFHHEQRSINVMPEPAGESTPCQAQHRLVQAGRKDGGREEGMGESMWQMQSVLTLLSTKSACSNTRRRRRGTMSCHGRALSSGGTTSSTCRWTPSSRAPCTMPPCRRSPLRPPTSAGVHLHSLTRKTIEEMTSWNLHSAMTIGTCRTEHTADVGMTPA